MKLARKIPGRNTSERVKNDGKSKYLIHLYFWAKRNEIINQVEKEIPPPSLFFPLEEYGEIVSMPVGSSASPEGGTGGVVIAHSHVIIITKTEFGRTGWEIEEEERKGGIERWEDEEIEKASERANCDET